ncbi:MAG: hypothetical protein ACT4PG_14735 [Panacagrimonas sp.]
MLFLLQHQRRRIVESRIDSLQAFISSAASPYLYVFLAISIHMFPIYVPPPEAQTMTDETEHDELQRLREHNKQLLSELKAVKVEAKTATDAATEAHKARDDWKSRWYALEVSAPLERDLRDCAVGPWKYLRDTATELGLLKMEADDEGIERPQWFEADGKPADLKRGLYRFLSDVYDADKVRFSDIGHSIRGSGTSGSGAPTGGSYFPPSPPKPAEVQQPPAPQLGLR